MQDRPWVDGMSAGWVCVLAASACQAEPTWLRIAQALQARQD